MKNYILDKNYILVCVLALLVSACSSGSKKVSEADVLRATGLAEDADTGHSLSGDERTENLLQQQAQREEQRALQDARVSRLENSYSDTGAGVRTPATHPSVEEGVATGPTDGELDLDDDTTTE